MAKELQRYTDEELARELRSRGFEVWKWDSLPDWGANLQEWGETLPDWETNLPDWEGSR